MTPGRRVDPGTLTLFEQMAWATEFVHRRGFGIPIYTAAGWADSRVEDLRRYRAMLSTPETEEAAREAADGALV